MSAELDLYEDPASLPYDGLVAAWHEVESRSAWFKARLAAAVAKGDLGRFAADVGVDYLTVKHYRSVAEKYPAERFGRPIFSFSVAAALMAQKDRFALVSREEPWTQDEARRLVASRRKPGQIGGGSESRQHEDQVPKSGLEHLAGLEAKGLRADTADGLLSSGVATVEDLHSIADRMAGLAAAETEPVAETVTVAEPDPEPRQCPGCRSKDELISDLGKRLEAADRRIKALEDQARHPDKVLMAELEAVSADRDRLAALLAARPQFAPDGPEPGDPGDPQPEPQAADGPPCARCKAPGARLAWVLTRDGTKDSGWSCDDCLATLAGEHPDRAYSRDEPPDPPPVTTQAELDEIYASFDLDLPA